MAIAYLILVHYQPSHLARLIKALSSNSSYFFIHVDAKKNIEQFRIETSSYKNIIFLNKKDRDKVYWGGYSQVSATLKLLKSAVNHGVSFDRYCLLSGSDFPIKRTAYIEDEFHKNTEFISIYQKINYKENNLISDRIKYLHFWDNRFLNIRTAPSLRFTLRVHRALKMFPRRKYEGLDFYKGSQWWALTDDCIKFILKFIENHREYLLFHQYAGVPDEMFFHSIIQISPFIDNVFYNFEKDPPSKQQGFHHISWKNGRPRNLKESDLSTLMTSPALFARKFDEYRSSGLLLKLEQHLC